MIVRIALYLLAITAPLMASTAFGVMDEDSWFVIAALWFGLSGLTVLSIQFVLASRSKWVERVVGLDAVYRFHRAMAICAAILLSAHPVLVSAGHQRWSLLTSFHQSPRILAGKLSLLLLLMLAVVSLYRLAFRISFERWRAAHNLLAVLALLLGCSHASYVGQVSEVPAFRIVPATLLIVAACAYVYSKLIVPSRSARSPYVVLDVIPEAGDVTTLRLAPTRRSIERSLPGQFAFIRFLIGSAVPPEEHPFTISSAPSESGILSFTIKNSGDFTAIVKEARRGDLVAVQGPFGVFSNAMHPRESDLVFIAGGIGITPLMSMIRAMRAGSADTNVLLIYGNETEGEIVFREELDDIVKSGDLGLRVIHVLNRPGDDWQGERGYITRGLILRECGEDLAGKTFYVCGPVGMMDHVRRILRDLGVAKRRILWERFSL